MKKYFGLLLLMSTSLFAQIKESTKKTAKTDGSTFLLTIEKAAEKKEIRNTHFETWGSSLIPSGKTAILNFGGSNKKNEASVSCMITLPIAKAGTYKIDPEAEVAEGETPPNVQLMTTLYPKIPQFVVKNGIIIIESISSTSVKGTFTITFTGGLNTDGILDENEYIAKANFSIIK